MIINDPEPTCMGDIIVCLFDIKILHKLRDLHPELCSNRCITCIKAETVE